MDGTGTFTNSLRLCAGFYVLSFVVFVIHTQTRTRRHVLTSRCRGNCSPVFVETEVSRDPETCP